MTEPAIRIPLDKNGATIALDRETIETRTVFKIGGIIGMNKILGMPADWERDEGAGRYSGQAHAEISHGDDTQRGHFTFRGKMDGAGQFLLTSITLIDGAGNMHDIKIKDADKIAAKDRALALNADGIALLQNALADAIRKNPQLRLNNKPPAIHSLGGSLNDFLAEQMVQNGKGVVADEVRKILPSGIADAVIAYTGSDMYNTKDEARQYIDGNPELKQEFASIGEAMRSGMANSAYTNLTFARAQLNDLLKNEPGVILDEKDRLDMNDRATRVVLSRAIAEKTSALEYNISEYDSYGSRDGSLGGSNVTLEKKLTSEQLLPLFIAAQNELQHFDKELEKKNPPQSKRVLNSAIETKDIAAPLPTPASPLGIKTTQR